MSRLSPLRPLTIACALLLLLAAGCSGEGAIVLPASSSDSDPTQGSDPPPLPSVPTESGATASASTPPSPPSSGSPTPGPGNSSDGTRTGPLPSGSGGFSPSEPGPSGGSTTPPEPSLPGSSLPPSTTCGDGTRDPGEDCDGDDLGGESCDSLGFAGGTLACAEDCTFDTAACEVAPFCGDGILDEDLGEECDEGDANSNRLPDACRLDCTLPRCGDGVVDTGEQCDDGPANGPGGACTEDCRINAAVACADLGSARDLNAVGVPLAQGVGLWHASTLAPMVGPSFASEACGDELARWREIYFFTAPEAGLWELGVVDTFTSAQATVFALRECDADARVVACGAPEDGGALRLDLAEGEALFVALEAPGTARAYGLSARRLEGVAAEDEPCGGDVVCGPGLICVGRAADQRCADPDRATLDTVSVVLVQPDLFAVTMRGTDPAEVLDLWHLAALDLSDGRVITDLTVIPDFLLRSGSEWTMRLFIPVSLFDVPDRDLIRTPADFATIAVAAESSRSGQRTEVLEATFPAAFTAPEEVAEGAPCDLIRVAQSCAPGLACAGEAIGASTGTCAEPAAPRILEAVVERDGLDALRVLIDGEDPNGDATALRVTLYRPGDVTPSLAFDPLILDEELRGESRFTLSLLLRDQRFNGILNALRPDFGFDRIGFVLIDATGLESEVVRVPYPAVEEVPADEPCDLGGRTTYCAQPAACVARRDGPPTCGDAQPPEVRGLSVRFEGGLAVVTFEGAHENADITGWDVLFRLADPPDPDIPFVGIVNQPPDLLFPPIEGQVHFVTSIPRLNLAGFELVSVGVRLRSGTRVSTLREVALDPRGPAEVCDGTTVWSPCATGLTCVDNRCVEATEPVLDALQVRRLSREQLRLSLSGRDAEADVDTVEMVIRRPNGVVVGAQAVAPDAPGVVGEAAFIATVTLDGVQNARPGTAWQVRLRDRGGLFSRWVTATLPDLVAPGQPCVDGTGVEDLCDAGTVCLAGVCRLPGEEPESSSGPPSGSGSGEEPGGSSVPPSGSGSGEEPGGSSVPPSGSGSGDPPGSGSGDPPGSGSGDPPGSGSGDPPGSGDGSVPATE